MKKSDSHKPTPPRWADRFLSWYCSDHFLEEIQGDLHERFYKSCEKRGPTVAKRQFIIQVFRFMRPFRIKKLEEWNIPQMNPAMFNHYLKIAWRNLINRRGFALGNIVGLGLGMAACMLILLYVSQETSYDRFHTHAENLYRLNHQSFRNGKWRPESIFSGFAIGPLMEQNLPEVENFTRIHPWYNLGLLAYEDEQGQEHSWFEQKGLYVDPAFLQMFDFQLLQGSRVHALEERNTMLITAAMARKYFGTTDDVIGKVVEVSAVRIQEKYRIVGVLEDIPVNTHFDFEFLMPLADLLDTEQYKNNDGWGWYNFYTYVQLKQGVDTTNFQTKAEQSIKPFLTDNRFGAEDRFVPCLYPVTDIHLYSSDAEEFKPGGNADSVSFFMLIAVLIMIIAWINYINLSTARAMERSFEIGIRKTIGAQRGQLIRQFLLESLFLNILGGILAIAITMALLPFLNELTGKSLSLDLSYNTGLWAILLLSFLLGALLSGLYPAFVLSAFRPVSVLKGGEKMTSGLSLRKVLVVFQFAASVGLIAGTYTVYRQINYMKSQDLGMQLDQVLVMQGPRIFEEGIDSQTRMKSLKNELRTINHIKHISGAGAIPGGGYQWGTGVRKLGQPEAEEEQVSVVWVDNEFLDTYGMKLIAGRNFLPDYSERGVLINETTVRLCELGSADQAINERLNLNGDTLLIAGVLQDYGWNSLRQAHSPIILMQSPRASNKICIKLETTNLPETLDKIEEAYTSVFPGNPFEYYFQDEFFDRQYGEDQRFGSVFGLFTILALLVACLGLLGLASFTASLRQKEIGIRKVIGANLNQLVLLLSKDFMILVGIAIVIGLPVSWWLTSSWLETFPFRISLGGWFFVVPAVLVSLIALLTIGYRTVRTAMVNPADVLRGD